MEAKRAANILAVNKEVLNLKKAAETGNLASNRVDFIGTQVTQNRLNIFKNIVDIITKPFRKVGSVVFDGKNPIAHYVALAVVILVLIGGLSFVFTSGPRKGMFRSLTSNPYNVVTRIFAKLLPGYRSRLMAKSLTPYSGLVPSVPRKKIIGRCDNMTMREASTKGGGLCERVILPKDIRWVLDSENIPEMDKIPSLLKSKLTGENGEKYIVYIPWKIYPSDGLNYYPDCSKAKFSDGTDASGLFTDNDTAFCTKKYVRRSTYEPRYRPLNMEGNTNYRGLEGYASENNPMC